MSPCSATGNRNAPCTHQQFPASEDNEPHTPCTHELDALCTQSSYTHIRIEDQQGKSESFWCDGDGVGGGVDVAVALALNQLA